MKENKQLNRSLKLIAKTSFIVFIGLILSKIFAYVYRIIIARHFGPEVYGLFSLAFMITGWFVTFFSFGISNGLLRYIVLYRGKKEINKIKYILKKSSTILLISGIISGLLLFFLSDFISINIFHNPRLIIFLKIFSVLIPIWIFLHIFITVIRAFEKINAYSFFVNIFENLTKLLILIILIIIGLNSSSIIYSFFLGVLATLVATYLYSKYKLPTIFGFCNLKEREKKNITRDLISYSWPIMFAEIITIIFYWVDSFAVGYLRNVTEVGLYNAAVPIAILLSFSPELFMQLFFPLITKEFSRKRLQIIKELSKQVGKWIFILNVPLFLFMILFPGAIINIFFGTEYLIAIKPLRFLAIGSFFSSLSIISLNLILTIGKSKLIFVDTLITLIINIFLNILLVPLYGINGAAFSTMISLIILSLTFFFQARYYILIIPLRRKMINIFFIGIISAIFLLFIKQFVSINLFTLILLSFFFILLYFLLIFITGCLDKNDLMIIKTIKKRLIRQSFFTTQQ